MSNDAVRELWRRGNLDYLLRPEQLQMRKELSEYGGKIRVLLCSRRIGKTFVLLVTAIEMCIKEKCTIKYLCPKQRQGERNIAENLDVILEDCPQELMPTWKDQKKVWVFSNGSRIEVAGTDNNNAENLRGGSSKLCIVDEAGFASDLAYAIRSILGPTVKTTKGHIYLVSTPSKSSNHEFITEFVKPAQASKKLVKFTIHDSTVDDEATIDEEASMFPMGRDDPGFKREYECEIISDGESVVFPGFNEKNENIIVTDQYKKPPFCDYYVSGDIGFKDLTAFLFSYWDYMEATLVIEDELIIYGPALKGQSLTQALASGIKDKEAMHFSDKEGNVKKPMKRVMDNDLIVIQDLQALHQLNFLSTAKDNKEAQVNQANIMLAGLQVRIHPRCKHLIYHLKNAEWSKGTDGSNKARKFLRIPDSSDKTIKGGHADAADAFIYLVRNIIRTKNPYPENWGAKGGGDVFLSQFMNQAKHSLEEKVKRILNIKPARKD